MPTFIPTPIIITMHSPRQRAIYDAVEEMPVGQCALFDPAELHLDTEQDRHRQIDLAGRAVSTVRARHFPGRVFRNFWHEGKIAVSRTA